MATTNIINMDFDAIKADLIDYIKSNSEFNGADFEGSALNIISDILAYTAHMTNITANISANEMFLDSAQLRSSVVSKAKELGYVPKSVTAARAKLQLIFNRTEEESGESRFVIPTGTKFISDEGATFSTIKDYVVDITHDSNYVYQPINGSEVTQGAYIGIKEIDIYEGVMSEFRYLYSALDANKRFIIPAQTVDISTLRVFVSNDLLTNDADEFKLNNNINTLTPDSKVYFLQQNPDGYHEVIFGDGILGKALIDGQYVILQYLIVQEGIDANGATHFRKAQTLGGYNNYIVNCVQGAVEGSQEESIDSIKYFAPKFYQMQSRAVVKNDYEVLLKHEYPWIASLSIWGGQDNNPPQFGKIFFAIRSRYTDILATNIKKRIEQDLIDKYNVITVQPVVVDPDYLYIGIKSSINYNPERLNITNEVLQNMIKTGINIYFEEYIEDFGRSFYLSPLTTIIDNIHNNIVSSTTEVFISKRFSVTLYSNDIYDLFFYNEIIPGSIKSTYFGFGNSDEYTMAYLKDEQDEEDKNTGHINIYSASTDNIIVRDVGTVKYDVGNVSFNIIPYNLPEESFMVLYAVPKSFDIRSKNDTILMKDKFLENTVWGLRHGTVITLKPVEINT